MNVHTNDGRSFPAITFVVNRQHPQYAGKLALEQQVEVLSSAEGAFGSSGDYLERTRVALIAHGIADPYLDRLADLIADRCGTPPGEPPLAPEA